MRKRIIITLIVIMVLLGLVVVFSLNGGGRDEELDWWRDRGAVLTQPPPTADGYFGRTLPLLGQVRTTARQAEADARSAKLAGDYSAADEAVLRGLTSIAKTMPDRLIVVHLSDLSLVSLALESLDETYGEGGLPSDEVVASLDRIDLESAFMETVKDEAAYLLTYHVQGYADTAVQLQPMGFGGRSSISRLLSHYRDIIEESEAGVPLRSLDVAGDPTLLDRITQTPLDGLVSSKRVSLAYQARVEMAKLAIRLRAYKLEHGTYPDDLAVLDNVPLDPTNGLSFAYEREGDGFVLRSRDPEVLNGVADWQWEK